MLKKLANNVIWFRREKVGDSPDSLYEQLVQMDAVDAVVNASASRPPSADIASTSLPELSDIESARAFFNEMMEFVEGDIVKMQHVEHSYQKMAIERHWAPLSMKALSMHLVAFGCKRKRIGREKITVLQFPMSKTQRK